MGKVHEKSDSLIMLTCVYNCAFLNIIISPTAFTLKFCLIILSKCNQRSYSIMSEPLPPYSWYVIKTCTCSLPFTANDHKYLHEVIKNIHDKHCKKSMK